MALFECFFCNFEKLLSYLKSKPSNFPGKFFSKLKILKSRSKYVYYLGTFGLEFEVDILSYFMSYLKSISSTFSKSKVLCKNKNL